MSTNVASNQKPTLSGVRIKQRKGAAKAASKFEPTIFRDQLYEYLIDVKSGDYDKFVNVIIDCGNTLDYHKYGEILFELLIAGAMIAPGGNLVDDGGERCPLNVFDAEKPNVPRIVSVFNNVIRRYKYLQKSLEETTRSIIQYANRWSPEQDENFSNMVGYCLALGLLNCGILTVLTQEHLVKDGISLRFVTSVFKVYLEHQSIEQLSSALRKGSITDLLKFFPAKQQNFQALYDHFNNSGLKQVADYYSLKLRNSIREETIAGVSEMVKEEKPVKEILEFLLEKSSETKISGEDFIGLIWNGLTRSIDMTQRQEQTEQSLVRTLNKYAPILQTYSETPKIELALLLNAQRSCYEDAILMKAFSPIVQLLYKNDVVSDGAILYWYTKGAGFQGKSHFIKSLEPFVKWLQEQSDDEEEDDE